jgi:DNA-binding transcriptional regulator LsrR (DeoR family)
MAKTITPDQLVGAARELDQDDFTRDEVAAKLGVGKPKVKDAIKAARASGRLEKVRDDEDSKGRFRVADQG